MKKLNALNLGESLNREEMKTIGGGLQTWCKRRITNVEDLRAGASGFSDIGYMNPFGCWIYVGMDPNSLP